jgi:hypothetical protein
MGADGVMAVVEAGEAAHPTTGEGTVVPSVTILQRMIIGNPPSGGPAGPDPQTPVQVTVTGPMVFMEKETGGILIIPAGMDPRGGAEILIPVLAVIKAGLTPTFNVSRPA